MKFFFSLLLSFCLLHNAFASTNIATPTVSGHWTLEGSPYLIFNDIQIYYDSILIIDPGVEVIFQGLYGLSVSGGLIAIGAPISPINFRIQDTTGLFNYYVTNGGWLGISFGYSHDSSKLMYCNLYNTKSYCDSITHYYWGCNTIGATYCSQSISITHCNFYQNTSDAIFGLYSDSLINFSNNNVYDNKTINCLFSIFKTNNMGFSNNHIYNNTVLYELMYWMSSDFVMKNCEINNNSVLQGQGIVVDSGSAVFIGNKVHHNMQNQTSVFEITSCNVLFERNIICNNSDTSSLPMTCGLMQGGVVIRLFNCDTLNVYNIKNNIIANNYSQYNASVLLLDGMDASTCKINIINNDIINNNSNDSSLLFGNIRLVADSLIATIKNNIFFGNVVNGLYPLDRNIFILGKSLLFENNWMDASFSGYVNNYNATLLGDTTTNIIGTNPGLVAPTLLPDTSENALLANFNLLTTSICINHGDNSVVNTGDSDYAGNCRIAGMNVDIGAYESMIDVLLPTNYNAKLSLDIFPNPANNFLTVSTSVAKGYLKIVDMEGKVFAVKNIADLNATTFDIHSLPRGFYFVIWNYENDEKIAKKILID